MCARGQNDFWFQRKLFRERSCCLNASRIKRSDQTSLTVLWAPRALQSPVVPLGCCSGSRGCHGSLCLRGKITRPSLIFNPLGSLPAPGGKTRDNAGQHRESASSHFRPLPLLRLSCNQRDSGSHEYHPRGTISSACNIARAERSPPPHEHPKALNITRTEPQHATSAAVVRI